MVADFQSHAGGIVLVVGLLALLYLMARAPKQDPTLRPPADRVQTRVEPKPKRARFLP